MSDTCCGRPSGCSTEQCLALFALWLVASPPAVALEEREAQALRERMVQEQLIASPDARQPVTDPRVLAAMRAVPRHRFVPPAMQPFAYLDRPVPIGEGQTISQPYIVALMTELAQLAAGERVLEVGTGSGYQAAILAELGASVYTIEILEPLARQAEATLRALGAASVQVRVGDGYLGWPEAAPFDAILVTAAAPRIPGPLIEQLANNGRLVIPLGEWFQELRVITKTPEGLREERVIPVVFVPMVGKVREPVDE